jgi:hypothetical protein
MSRIPSAPFLLCFRQREAVCMRSDPIEHSSWNSLLFSQRTLTELPVHCPCGSHLGPPVRLGHHPDNAVFTHVPLISRTVTGCSPSGFGPTGEDSKATNPEWSAREVRHGRAGRTGCGKEAGRPTHQIEIPLPTAQIRFHLSGDGVTLAAASKDPWRYSGLPAAPRITVNWVAPA